MVTEYLIVDGYNILNNWPEFKGIKEAELAHARDNLIKTLANYQALTGIQIIVVFDAHLVQGGLEREEIIDGVRVIYSREGETADSLIERLLYHLPDSSSVTVATSDWAEQRMVLGKGGLRISARELRELIQAAEKDSVGYYRSNRHQADYLDSRLGENLRQVLEKLRRQP
ncbi:MAG: NYN domain-containing protein [Clostridia bacterium]|jgi:predicted RNA-binding protein with PIN domain|nr:NYN domain-containing protein [Clostridia bacterium]